MTAYFDEHGDGLPAQRRLDGDPAQVRVVPGAAAVENTDFLQAVTLLTTRKRNLADTAAGRRRSPPSARTCSS